MDGEAPSVYSESHPKAAKDHVCYECGRVIPKGQKYHVIKGCWDGSWSKFKTCEPCEELRLELKYEGDCAPFGSLADWAADAGVEFPVAA